MRFWIPLLACWLAAPALAETAAEHLERIRQIRPDASECYRVRDIFLEREDVRLYLTEGYLVFAEPLDGRRLAAMFLSTRETDYGEILVIPPNEIERRSLARFTGGAVLEQKFRTLLMAFTDDTAERLREELALRGYQPDAGKGRQLARRWSPLMSEFLHPLGLRILLDTFADIGAEQGFFGAVVDGGPLGRFDVLIDPRRRGQVSLGQSVSEEGRTFYETWVRFPGRRFRRGDRAALDRAGRMDNFRIDAALKEDLSMQVVAQADFMPQTARERVFLFELSEQLEVTKVLADGEAAEFLQLFDPASRDAQRRHNGFVAVVLPRKPAQQDRYRLEFHYEGRVVAHAGSGVYYVGSRGNWYPWRSLDPASFDLRFQYPSDLDLVATGVRVDFSEAGDVRSARFRTPSPIRVAGFNLGRYQCTSREVDGYEIEVCADRAIRAKKPEPALLPVSPSVGRTQRFPWRPEVPAVLLREPPPERPLQPADRLDTVAKKSAEAFSFFAELFGPPAVPRIVISPIPGGFGQGFPGLVYTSTLSYFNAEDPPLQKLDPARRTFFAELLRSHEISHQWWGGLVNVDSLNETWLMEALATYSALLLLEHRQGGEALKDALEQARRSLLAHNEDGETVESAGAIVLGFRLRSSEFPDARRVITYEKGAWILHMLRSILGDEKFFEFLRALAGEYQDKPLTTEEFRKQAAKRLPKNWPDPELVDFFDDWVYGAGVPSLNLTYKTKGSPPHVRFAGKISQTGVPPSFTVPVPVEIQLAPGRSLHKTVFTQGEVTEFEVGLKEQPIGAALDPARTILAEREP